MPIKMHEKATIPCTSGRHLWVTQEDADNCCNEVYVEVTVTINKQDLERFKAHVKEWVDSFEVGDEQ